VRIRNDGVVVVRASRRSGAGKGWKALVLRVGSRKSRGVVGLRYL